MTSRQFGQAISDTKLYQRIRELARQARYEHLENGLTSREEIADHHRLTLAETAFPKDGALIEDTIILSTFGTSEERRNFTFYHELTHHLIRQDDALLSDIHEIGGDPDRLIEKLCNFGAAELLVPTEEVQSHVDSCGFSASAIPLLCERFVASGIVVAIQMVTLASHECYLVIATPVEQPVAQAQLRLDDFNSDNHPVLQIQYSARSSSARYVIAWGTVIRHDHMIAEAHKHQCELKGKAGIPFRTGVKMSVDCNSIYFRGSVYAFFNVEPPMGVRPQRMF